MGELVQCDGSTTIDRETVLQSSGVEAIINNEQIRVNIPKLLYGDGPKALATHLNDADDPYCAIVDTNDLDAFYCGQVSLLSLPYSASTRAVIQHNVGFPQSGLFYADVGSVAITPFSWSQASAPAAVTIGTIPSGSGIFLVVREYTTGIASAAITVAGTAQTVDSQGVWKIGDDTTSQATAQTVNAAHTLGSNQVLSGYVLVGPQMTID